MRATIPSRWVDGTITVPVRSSDGKVTYHVPLSGDHTYCGCRGGRYKGKCRHQAAVRTWLTAVIPPRTLPE